MRKWIDYLLLAVCLIGTLSCSNEETMPSREENSALPIQFITEYPVMGGQTKAAGQKTDFAQGNAIQVSAVFYDANGNKLEESAYNCLVLQDDLINWEATSETPMMWPYEAAKGTFTAYYLPTLEGALADGKRSESVYLETLKHDEDPLFAEAIDVTYGHAVPLSFKHLCTRLILAESISKEENEFWLSQPDIPNRFSLNLNDDQTLSFAFEAGEEEPYDGRIARKKETDDGTVVFYLAPTVTDEEGTDNNLTYQGARLDYRHHRPYLTLNLPELGNLEANHSYILDITKQSGIILTPDEGGWKEPTDPVSPADGEINIQDFLNAIASGSEYYTKAVNDKPSRQVLKKEDDHLALLLDVDFNNQTYTPVELTNTRMFDGNFHYLMNLSGPIFTQSNATINSLGIKNITINNPDESKFYTDSKTLYIGGLIGNNKGELRQLRMEGKIDINITIPPNETNDIIVYNIGTLCGASSKGRVEDIELEGGINIKTTGANLKNTHINLGGVVGQDGSDYLTGIHYGAKGCNLYVTNECTGAEGIESCTGGLVGFMTGSVSDCLLPNVIVDASNSTGNKLFIGGLIGWATGQSPQTDKLENCLVSGTVKGGVAKSIPNSEEYNKWECSTGGLVGRVDDPSIYNCSAVNINVQYGSTDVAENNTNYTLGGLIGAVGKSIAQPVQGCLVTGKVGENQDIQDQVHFTGGFAGVWHLDDEGTNNQQMTNLTNFFGRLNH